MLQSIREKTTGWIAYTIIFLISVPFALWGVNSYLGGGELAPAATVNGQEISVQDLDVAYANYRRRLTQVFGGTIPESFGSESQLKDQVLSQLIQENSLRDYAETKWFRIGDVALNNIIRNMEVFQQDGKFDEGIYRAQIGSQGYSPQGFEQQLRMSSAMNQLQSGVIASSFSVPAVQDLEVKLASQSRKTRTLTKRVNGDDLQVSDTEVADNFKANAAQYRSPEQLKIEYIELDLETIKNSVSIEESQLVARYQQNIDQLTTPEIRNASHILLTIKSDASDDDVEQGRQKLKDIKSQISSGVNFADLARDNSEDPGSANDGGLLGDIERGDMVQAFEDTLYQMEVDQISEPVKTSFGWHLIKLNSISGGETTDFESVREKLRDELLTETAESQIYDMAENLANLAYEQPDSLLPAAETLDLELHTSDWFSRGSGDGIASEEKVRQAAFSKDVLVDRLNSEAVELGSDTVVFMRLLEHKDAAPKALEEVRDEVVASVKRNKAERLASEAGESALNALRSGKSLDDIAEEWSETIVDLDFVSRDGNEVGFLSPSTDICYA